jgi:thiol-disulfide isomerase/thioredoxin
VATRPGFTHRRERRPLIGPFTGRQLLAGALAVIVAGVVLVVVTTPIGGVNPIGPGNPQPTQYVINPNAPPGLKAGDQPPELTVSDPSGQPAPLTDLEGRPVSLAALRGKAIWINFWASWCPPCQSETPILRDIAAAYRDRGLVVVGIAVQETSPADVFAYADRYRLGYVVAGDWSGDVFRSYRLRGLPTQFFIGPEGAIRAVVPAPMSAASARAQVEAILPAPTGAAPSSARSS